MPGYVNLTSRYFNKDTPLRQLNSVPKYATKELLAKFQGNHNEMVDISFSCILNLMVGAIPCGNFSFGATKRVQKATCDTATRGRQYTFMIGVLWSTLSFDKWIRGFEIVILLLLSSAIIAVCYTTCVNETFRANNLSFGGRVGVYWLSNVFYSIRATVCDCYPFISCSWRIYSGKYIPLHYAFWQEMLSLLCPLCHGVAPSS